jgi:deazaflavin-dependent oxidoreductase (nitroreductase family)
MNQQDVNHMNRDVIQQFRANGGRILSGRFANSNLLLLKTTGAKSGAERVNPLMYVRDGERLIVFASKAGALNNPDWYHNLLAQPDVAVEIGEEQFRARAAVSEGAERQRIWDESVRKHPFLADMQARTPRQLPVIVLERVE